MGLEFWKNKNVLGAAALAAAAGEATVLNNAPSDPTSVTVHMEQVSPEELQKMQTPPEMPPVTINPVDGTAALDRNHLPSGDFPHPTKEPTNGGN